MNIAEHAAKNIADGLADLDIEIQSTADAAYLSQLHALLKPLSDKILILEALALRKSEGRD